MNNIQEIVANLHIAAETGDARAVDHLLAVHRPLVNSRDRYGRTALHQAAYFNHVDVVRVLIQRGADIHIKDGCGQTALETAREQGNQKVVMALAGYWRPTK